MVFIIKVRRYWRNFLVSAGSQDSKANLKSSSFDILKASTCFNMSIDKLMGKSRQWGPGDRSMKVDVCWKLIAQFRISSVSGFWLEEQFQCFSNRSLLCKLEVFDCNLDWKNWACSYVELIFLVKLPAGIFPSVSKVEVIYFWNKTKKRYLRLISLRCKTYGPK